MSEEMLNALPSQPVTDTPDPNSGAPPLDAEPPLPNLAGPGRRTRSRPRPGAALQKPSTNDTSFTPEQRLLILDAWKRSGLPAGDFAPLVGLSRYTLYAWKKRF